MVVLVTGANGQLGQSIQFIAHRYPDFEFHFLDSKSLDITNPDDCNAAFNRIMPDYCINTAAYTAVDKAETASEMARLVNVNGAENLARSCKGHQTVLIHISTDFVFDGSAQKPYTETDTPNPTGVYGQTKLDGERMIQSVFENYYIIRTSWVYSQFGHNFLKTMLRLGGERDSVSVVDDQIGTPTNAVDLANVVLSIIQQQKNRFGLYNFSNEGQCSWYDFAKKIFEFHKIEIDLLPIPTSSYPTPARRPKYSVLDKSKIRQVFGLQIQSWEQSLKQVR